MTFLRRALPLALAATLLATAPASAVVGGGPAEPGRYPHMAALMYDHDDNPSTAKRFRCGASLVAPDTVLTAAHCLRDEDDEGREFTIPAARVDFLLGTYDRSSPETGETIGAVRVDVHEGFEDPESFSNDIALVRLARAATRATTIPIVTPAQRALWEPGVETTVTGWGTAFFPDLLGLTVQDDLQEVGVPIVDDADCESTNFEPVFDPETLVCAGNLQGTEDACQGDSGGPLMGADASGAPILVGVVSSGLGCGYPTQYGQYARIGDPPLQDWLRARLPAATAAPAPATTTPASGGQQQPSQQPPTPSSGAQPSSGSPGSAGDAPPFGGSGSVGQSGSAAPAAATRRTTLRVRSATLRGRRVRLRLSSTRALRGVRVTVQRVRGTRRTTVARRSLARISRGQRLGVNVGRRSSTRGTLRVRVTGRDANGRLVSATRAVQRSSR